ncbi:alkaline phosphatase family protein [Labilibaculum euxinus]|uniref:Alkaline phosphatase family protein n=1 Tax=Labilibaculum euxinus TaxID=2686357 RepID=A0A7M4D1P7_9BACT|nr:alkaline phosphatase family protein [Labilibaculum euxinus]MUP36576.1 alkaline phosphatase family protein [Labilibaculum euxinus]MVB05781.1 alkaline phosphatase family protein [Labilibaculum euxinus]
MSKRFGTLLFAFLVFTIQFSIAQNTRKIPSEKPKLVVGIVVDHLRADYFFRYSNLLGDGGFKRLMNQGTYCKNAKFSYLYSQTGPDHASIFTGTPPAFHGIISNGWYNRLSGELELAKEDSETKLVGIESEEKGISPKKMLASTLGDEIKLFNSRSRVVGVALNCESALFSAGHAADGAYWMDDLSGKFITSSYYQDTLYNWVKEFNEKKFADFYLNRVWTPFNDGNAPSVSDKLLGKVGLNNQFFYDLNKEKREHGYKAIKKTPFGNMLVKDFAISAIINENLGKDDDADFLSVTFSCLEEKHRDLSPFAPEMIDNFIRLDQELEHFLSFLDEQIGLENVLVFVTADQSANYTPENLSEQNIPNGYFSTYNAIALLKSYFNILYGNGEWVLGYDSQQVYLNHQLIEDSKLSIIDLQTKAAEFLIQFSGVATTTTANSLVKSNYTHGILQKVQRSFNQKRSGDVMLTLEQGWMHKIKDERDEIAQYSYTNQVPLFWYGWKIKRSVISRSVYIEDIVPTVSSFLNISIPSGCDGNPIEELVN